MFENVCYLNDDGLLVISTASGSYVFPLQFVSSIRSHADGYETRVRIKTSMSKRTFSAMCSPDELRPIIGAWKNALDTNEVNYACEHDQTVCCQIGI